MRKWRKGDMALDKSLPIAETQEEVNTPLWLDIHLTNGDILEHVNPKHLLYIYHPKYGKHIEIYGKKYSDKNIETIYTQYPQPCNKLMLEMIGAFSQLMNTDGELIK